MMMTDTSNWSECKQPEERKREREDIDDRRTKSIDTFGQKKAKGLDGVEIENNDRFSSVSTTTRHSDCHHVIGSDSSSTTMTSSTATKTTSSNRKRLPKSKKERKSNRIPSLHSRRRKKAWVHELEQTVYAMMKHNHSMEQKNKNLEKLLEDTENYVQENNVTVEVNKNSNSNVPTISMNEMVINSNPLITPIGNIDGTVITNTEVLIQPQPFDDSTYQSSVNNTDSDFVVNDSLSIQRNKPMCSNKQYNDIQQAFNYYPSAQRQENQLMIKSPINPIIDAIFYNMVANSNHLSRFYDNDNNSSAPNAARIFGDDYMYSGILHQWMEQLNQKGQQQRLNLSTNVDYSPT